MAMAATQLATQISSKYSSISSLQRPKIPFTHKTPSHLQLTTSYRRISLVQASKPPTDETTKVDGFQEDLAYLVKLGAGSVAGAAAIKYGSIIFPDITRPNIVEALLIISAPVVVAVVLLIKQSRID